jgi:WD40 repeat protein/uncharacterized caspase-like protein
MDKGLFRCFLSLSALLSLLQADAAAQSATSEPTKPEPVLQVGHRQAVQAVVFSPDGRWLASGAKDGTIKIWETNTGRLLRTLYGHGSSVNALAVSSDGKMLASGSGTIYDPRYQELFLKGGEVGGVHEEDTSVRLWDVSTGGELRMFSGHELAVAAVAFSRDNRSLTSVSSDSIRIWDLGSGNQIHSDKLISLPRATWGSNIEPHRGDVFQKKFKAIFKNSTTDILISSGGELVAVALPDKSFRLIDTRQGHELRSLDIKAQPEERSSLAFSPDAQKLAYLKNGKELALQAVTTGKDLWHFPLASGADTVVVCFTPDGSGLVVGRGEGQQSSVELLSAANGTEQKHFAIVDEALRLISYSPAADYVAVVPEGSHVVELRNAQSGQLLRLFKTPSPNITGPVADSANIDPELEKQLAGLGLTRKGEIIEAAEDVAEFSSTYRGGETVTFTADGKWLLTRRGRPGSLATVTWDSATGTQVQDTNRFQEIGLPGYSPDGRFKVAPQYFQDTRGFRMFDVSRSKNEFAQRVKLLDAHTGRQLHVLEVGLTMEVGTVPATGFNLDGSRIAVSGFKRVSFAKTTNAIFVFDTSDGKKLNEFLIPADEQSGSVNALAVSPDGQSVAAARHNRIDLYEASSGRLLRSIPHSGGIDSVCFHPGGRLLAVLGKDGDTYLFDIQSGQLLATLISVANASSLDWLVVSPDGLFDGSPPGWSQLLWRFSADIFNVAPVETFFNEFYYPGLLAEIMAGKTPTAPRNFGQLDRRQPSLAIVLQKPLGSERNATVELQVTEAPADSGHAQGSAVRDVRLFRNGSLVKVWHGDLPLDAKGHATLQATVPVVAGENRLTAYAFNHDNIKSSDATLIVQGESSLRRKGTAYVLTLGVNQYANTDYNLNLAVADARAFSEELGAQQKRVGNWSDIETVSLLDGEATKANFLAALKELSGTETVPPAGAPAGLSRLHVAQPEDAVFIYFAGHGIAVGPRFYLIPHDLGYSGKRSELNETGRQSILSHGISDLEVQDALEHVDAREVLLIIDACESGQALEAEEKRRGPMNSQGLAQLAYEKGMYVLTAAQGYQAALEVKQLGHGLLTYALVEEGLKTAAADTAPKDGQVVAREWLDYPTLRVPQLQESQMEQANQQGRELFFVDDEREKRIDLQSRSLQRPRVFYRREEETPPLVIAIPAPN